MNQTLLNDARDHARAILHHCVTPHGYRASALAALCAATASSRRSRACS